MFEIIETFTERRKLPQCYFQNLNFGNRQIQQFHAKFYDCIFYPGRDLGNTKVKLCKTIESLRQDNSCYIRHPILKKELPLQVRKEAENP